MPSSDPLVLVRYFDVVLVVLAAPFVLLMGGPALGYAVAAVTWIVTRFGGLLFEHRSTRRVAIGGAAKMQREKLSRVALCPHNHGCDAG